MCIRFMLFLLIWSAKENHQIHLILFNHRCHLLFAAHMADKAGGDERAVVAALFGLLGGQIPLRAARELDEEGLLGIRACLDLVAEVEEEFPGMQYKNSEAVFS